MDVLDAKQAGCDFASAKQLLGVAGSVSFHHGRAVHGSDLNRSRRPVRLSLCVSRCVSLSLSLCPFPCVYALQMHCLEQRRLLVIECIAADAWPLVDAVDDPVCLTDTSSLATHLPIQVY